MTLQLFAPANGFSGHPEDLRSLRARLSGADCGRSKEISATAWIKADLSPVQRQYGIRVADVMSGHAI
jgi:hypothetical protein